MNPRLVFLEDYSPPVFVMQTFLWIYIPPRLPSSDTEDTFRHSSTHRRVDCPPFWQILAPVIPPTLEGDDPQWGFLTTFRRTSPFTAIAPLWLTPNNTHDLNRFHPILRRFSSADPFKFSMRPKTSLLSQKEFIFVFCGRSFGAKKFCWTHTQGF